jgi:hypothetical protein
MMEEEQQQQQQQQRVQNLTMHGLVLNGCRQKTKKTTERLGGEGIAFLRLFSFCEC